MFNKLKQFQDLKNRAKQLQEALAQEMAEGSAGWGKVKVTVNGNQEVLGVSIDQAAMDDKAKLESMLKEAMNDGLKKIQAKMATKLKDIGGLDLAKEFGDAVNQ